MMRRRLTNADRVDLFWSKVDQASESCWRWASIHTESGYGRFWDGDRFVQAHRFAYESDGRRIPEGFQIDHLCKTRDCVRPSHLEAVTPWENTMRSSNHIAVNATKTHCDSGHEFTEENTYSPPSRPNRRTCRECMRQRTRAWRARKAAA